MAESWQDRGILLSLRPLNEGDVIASFLTQGHGRHAGVIRGGNSRRNRGQYQPGNLFDLTWTARLSEHLGQFRAEPAAPWGAMALADREALLRLTTLAAVVDAALPEREPHADLFDLAGTLLADLESPLWPASYALFEARLLTALGFGLDLHTCAATGATEALTHVSPRSGRAVSAAAAQPYLDRLLVLPAFLREGVSGPPPAAEALAALDLTGHFLHIHLFAPHRREMPSPRQRFIDRLRDMATISGV